MIINNNLIILQEFLQSPSQREWLYFPHLQVYLRKSKRAHPLVKGKLISCLDIANAIVSEGMRGRGVFKSWLDDVLELSTGFDAIYVENVQTRTFARYFERREEWLLVSQPDQGVKPCFLRFLGESYTKVDTRFDLYSLSPSSFTQVCKTIVELVGGHFGVSEIDDSILISQDGIGEEINLKFIPSSGSDTMEMSKKFLAHLAKAKIPSIHDGQRLFILSPKDFLKAFVNQGEPS